MTDSNSDLYHFLVYLIFGESYDFEAPPILEDPAELIKNVDSILSAFSYEEEAFLKARFGLNDGQIKSLEEMATLLGKSVGVVQDLEVELIKRLRHPARAEVLRKFLD